MADFTPEQEAFFAMARQEMAKAQVEVEAAKSKVAFWRSRLTIAPDTGWDGFTINEFNGVRPNPNWLGRQPQQSSGDSDARAPDRASRAFLSAVGNVGGYVDVDRPIGRADFKAPRRQWHDATAVDGPNNSVWYAVAEGNASQRDPGRHSRFSVAGRDSRTVNGPAGSRKPAGGAMAGAA